MRLFCAAAVIGLLTGCAASDEFPGALNDDVVVAGRISSVKEAVYFIGDTENVTYVLKVRSLFHPDKEIEFVAHDPRCPLRVADDRIYLLFLNKAVTIRDPQIEDDKGREGLEVFRCVFLDTKNSIGFIEEHKN